jgi:hypothetical protein
MSKVPILLLVMLSVSGCASQPPSVQDDAPGFFMGLIHGFLVLPSLFGSILFDIRVYAYPNSGFFYDWGFFIGVAIFFSLLFGRIP